MRWWRPPARSSGPIWWRRRSAKWSPGGFGDDTVRGVVATDALIGTHTSLFDAGLAANRCFLYHLIGRGTGEWLVPIGGMGGLADTLIARAGQAGVEMRCGVEVLAVDETATGVTLAARTADGREAEFAGDRVLAAVAPAVVQRWFGREPAVPRSGPR